MADETLLTSTQVAAILDVHPTTVQRLPRNLLPYTESPGGDLRGGRRRYRPEHVEAYRERVAGGRRRTLSDRMADLERRMGEVERRLDDQ